MKLTEAQVTKQVKDWLTSMGWVGYRLQSGTVRGLTRGTYITLNKAGTPDWFFCNGKRYVFVEIKAPGKALHPSQVEWFADANARGIPAFCADDLKTFQERFTRTMMTPEIAA